MTGREKHGALARSPERLVLLLLLLAACGLLAAEYSGWLPDRREKRREMRLNAYRAKAIELNCATHATRVTPDNIDYLITHDCPPGFTLDGYFKGISQRHAAQEIRRSIRAGNLDRLRKFSTYSAFKKVMADEESPWWWLSGRGDETELIAFMARHRGLDDPAAGQIFLRAIREGSVTNVSAFRDLGFELDVPVATRAGRASRCPYLTLPAFHADNVMLEWMFQNGVNPLQGVCGDTLFRRAVTADGLDERERLERLSMLLEATAPPADLLDGVLRKTHGEAEQTDVIALLLKTGRISPAAINDTLYRAVRRPDASPTVVANLLAAGADPLKIVDEDDGIRILDATYLYATTPEGFAIFQQVLAAADPGKLPELACELLPYMRNATVPLLQELIDAGLPAGTIGDCDHSGRTFQEKALLFGRLDISEMLPTKLDGARRQALLDEAIRSLLVEGRTRPAPGVFRATLLEGRFVRGVSANDARYGLIRELLDAGADADRKISGKDSVRSFLIRKYRRATGSYSSRERYRYRTLLDAIERRSPFYTSSDVLRIE